MCFDCRCDQPFLKHSHYLRKKLRVYSFCFYSKTGAQRQSTLSKVIKSVSHGCRMTLRLVVLFPQNHTALIKGSRCSPELSFRTQGFKIKTQLSHKSAGSSMFPKNYYSLVLQLSLDTRLKGQDGGGGYKALVSLISIEWHTPLCAHNEKEGF